MPTLDSSIIIDIAKWLLGGVAGYLIHEWKDIRKRQTLRKNLYRELSHNWEEVVRTLDIVEQRPELACIYPGNARLSLSNHEYAKGEAKHVYYHLSDCSVLNTLADEITTIINTPGRTHDGQMFAWHVQKALIDKQLDPRLFRKVSSAAAREFLDSQKGARHLWIGIPAR